MFTSNLRVAIRNLKKSKVFSFINIAGLAVGLAVFMLIMLWVKSEKDYNGFHKDKERIGAVMLNQTYSANEMATFPATPSQLAAAMKKDLPGVEWASVSSWGDVRLLTYGEKYSSEYGLYVENDFLKIFSFPLLKGDINKVLQQPNTILISETLAKKYFGSEDPIGKIIMVEKNSPCKVEGVLKDVPANSSLQFDFLMPARDYINWAMGGVERWEANNMRTYVKLKGGVDRAQLDASLKKFLNKYTEEKSKTELFIWNLQDWYLRFDFKNGVYAGGGRITYVRLFIIIAIFILALACINFMNLSTARATQRAKEVGVRKVIGAGKKSLVFQFMGESLLMAALGAVVALVLVILILPAFNNFLRKSIFVDYTDISTILGFIAIIIITGLLAGLYPSLILSSFRPIKVLKGLADSGATNTVWVRKALVVIQFAISILLIAGTMIVFQQVNYIKNKNLGYSRENLLWFANSVSQDLNETAITELKKVPGVLEACRGSMTFTMPNNRGTQVEWPGKQAGQEIFFNFITSDHHIIETMGIKMKEGRSFSTSYPNDTAAYILNEEAVKRMNLKNPVGQVIESYAGKGPIIGVTRDFHFESLHQPIGPVIIQCKPDWTWLFYVRIDGKNSAATINGIADVYKRLAPGYVFDYTFQDKEYERLFRSEQQVGTLVNWFAFFAIFISCLGLLGLTAYSVERKKKEIGIRKVLGASVHSVVTLISKQFLLLIAIAFLLAVAPAWYFMKDWLQQYAYRIELGWQVFVIAGLLALLVAVITISALAIKAALANPVRSLRTE